MWSYNLRLSIVGLRHEPGLTIAMFFCLTLGGGLWTTIIAHYLREYPFPPALSPSLHQVEIQHPRALALFKGTSAADSSWHARTRVTYPEYQLLSRSGIPARQTGSFRAQLLVAGDGAPAAQLRNARFVGADFFSMFQLPIGRGRPFHRSEELRQAPVMVIGRRLNDALFGGRDSAGAALIVEGRRFTVVGVTDDDQPYRPDWDVFWTGKDQDAFYVPISWAPTLGAWPGRMTVQSPIRAADDVWRSDGVFVAYWADLPTSAARAAYASYLATHLGGAGIAYHLRALDVWRKTFTIPPTDILYLTILFAAGLAGAGFTSARLLLAKGFARRTTWGIHRALGATRGALFSQQMIEAAIVALAAGLGAILNGHLQLLFHNSIVAESDIPLYMSMMVAVVGGASTFGVGLLAAAYPAWRMSRTTPTLYLGRL